MGLRQRCSSPGCNNKVDISTAKRVKVTFRRGEEMIYWVCDRCAAVLPNGKTIVAIPSEN